VDGIDQDRDTRRSFTVSGASGHLPCPSLEVRNPATIVRAGDLAETDRKFSQVRASIRKAFRRLGARTGTVRSWEAHAIARKRPSLLSQESCMHAGEADIAKKHCWYRVTEAAWFKRGRSCGLIATLSRFARNSRACLAALRFQLRLQDQGGPFMVRPFAACGSPLASPLGGQRVLGPFAYAASPPRSRHLCILHIRVRNVEGEIDTGIFGIRFVPRPGIIFWWCIV